MKKFIIKKSIIILLIYCSYILVTTALNLLYAANKVNGNDTKNQIRKYNFLPEYTSYNVKFLFKNEYLKSMLSDLRSAKKEIIVFMYLIRYMDSDNHPVYQLVSELISAKQRGVKIELYLDNAVKEGENRIPINMRIYDLLKTHNIFVKIDRGKKVYHSKIIIIDKETVYCGSHNWTSSAFNHNMESSVRIKSPELAKHLIKKIYADLNYYE
ncbi:MAG TPA: phospholipase D-like domain-containing protein [bacterium]|nr:phospholipase D-like domain-containing protein [bacterium]HPN31038.1 phospholipase D-like domain-containing protein [bacterium]